MRDSVENVLSSLGIALTSSPEGGWEVLVSPNESARHFAELDDIRIWLASWTTSEHSEYLAIQHFRKELGAADAQFLNEIGQWLEGKELTDRARQLRTVVDSIVLSYDSDFYPDPALIVSVLRERVGHPYHSLGARMVDSFQGEREKRGLAGV